MKNPLIKRLPRQLKDELGKYIVIFLFMILVIGFVSGFLVSANSMIFAYNESFDKYNCEYGHFITMDEPGIAAIESIEEETNVEIDEQFYYDLLTTGETLSGNTDDTSSDESTATSSDNSSAGSSAAPSDNSPSGATAVPLDISSPGTSTLRLFKIRENMNTACLMDGSLPSGDNEICIDRMYASNNGFEIGDSIIAGGQSLTITGLVALPDYSALFSENSDMMFDAVKFGVGIVSEDCFNSYEKTDQKLIYEYVWRYNSIPADEDEQIDMSDEFLKTVVKYVTLDDYLPRYANQAIKFTGVDFGGDSQMVKVILYVLIVVIAFVFSITIRHTIVREATVIGTLRASGYTKGELLRHYIALPVLITLISALIGNILGYTVFKDIAASMYYRSYSLP
ncbi:MAG: ABC transporter permease, partial [Eubacterium sp.]|nr:ABC transporter permease [Eubacterium sp.]